MKRTLKWALLRNDGTHGGPPFLLKILVDSWQALLPLGREPLRTLVTCEGSDLVVDIIFTGENRPQYIIRKALNTFGQDNNWQVKPTEGTLERINETLQN